MTCSDNKIAAIFDTRYDCPTNAGVLLFAKNLRRLFPGAYIQYVRYKGTSRAGEILKNPQKWGKMMGEMYKNTPKWGKMRAKKPQKFPMRRKKLPKYLQISTPTAAHTAAFFCA